MATPNILVTRIDNRLVHGQVGMTWVNTIGANLVVVANDDVAKDDVQQNLMTMVVPDTVGMRFFSIDKTIKVIGHAAPSQKILLVVRTPQRCAAAHQRRSSH
nr:PTS sugar transporter subunit IIB [Schleiferilactobacillus harbinensis]